LKTETIADEHGENSICIGNKKGRRVAVPVCAFPNRLLLRRGGWNGGWNGNGSGTALARLAHRLPLGELI
jgi:hypothetical protein